jgi:type I restriction enzyme M protein
MCVHHFHQVRFFHLRGNVDPLEYKHVVLSLIFLKFANGNFEEHWQELIAESKEQYLVLVEFYTIKNVFHLREKSRGSQLKN